MTWKLENPRAMVGFLLFWVVVLGALLEYDNRVLEQNIAALRYCIAHGKAGEF